MSNARILAQLEKFDRDINAETVCSLFPVIGSEGLLATSSPRAGRGKLKFRITLCNDLSDEKASAATLVDKQILVGEAESHPLKRR
jgi:hypothetical protein